MEPLQNIMKDFNRSSNHGYQIRPRVDVVKKSSPMLYGLTRINPNQLRKNKIKIEVLIFYMKKIRNNPCKYKLYML